MVISPTCTYPILLDLHKCTLSISQGQFYPLFKPQYSIFQTWFRKPFTFFSHQITEALLILADLLPSSLTSFLTCQFNLWTTVERARLWANTVFWLYVTPPHSDLLISFCAFNFTEKYWSTVLFRSVSIIKDDLDSIKAPAKHAKMKCFNSARV